MPDLAVPHGEQWSPGILKAHFDALREADSKAVAAALAAAEKAVDKALAAAALAVDKAEDNAKLWRASANEWRTAMDDREKKFMTQDSANAHFSAIETALADLKKSRDINMGRQTASTAGIALLFAIITVALRFL